MTFRGSRLRAIRRYSDYLSSVQTPDRMIHLVSSKFYYRFNLEWLKEPMPAKTVRPWPTRQPGSRRRQTEINIAPITTIVKVPGSGTAAVLSVSEKVSVEPVPKIDSSKTAPVDVSQSNDA